MTRFLLLFSWLLSFTACTKAPENTPTTSQQQPCTLQTLEYSSLGSNHIDSLIYENDRIKRVHSYMGNNRFKAVLYTYFGQDSVHLSEAYPGSSENFVLTHVFTFDTFNRLIQAREINVNETITYTYLPNDSIQVVVDQVPAYIMHRNAAGNIHYQRSLLGQRVVTTTRFDETAPNPFKGMLHNTLTLTGLSTHIPLNETITENGQPFWQKQWSVQKNAAGYITQWDDGNTRVNMTYIGCP